MLIILGDRQGVRLNVGGTRAKTSPPVMLSPISSGLGSHVEALRLAAAAKLPPHLICLRATRRPHREGEKRETEGEAVRGSEAGLGRWIWMPVRGSQTVRIKEKQ